MSYDGERSTYALFDMFASNPDGSSMSNGGYMLNNGRRMDEVCCVRDNRCVGLLMSGLIVTYNALRGDRRVILTDEAGLAGRHQKTDNYDLKKYIFMKKYLCIVNFQKYTLKSRQSFW